jgi:hypothetical protein
LEAQVDRAYFYFITDPDDADPIPGKPLAGAALGRPMPDKEGWWSAELSTRNKEEGVVDIGVQLDYGGKHSTKGKGSVQIYIPPKTNTPPAIQGATVKGVVMFGCNGLPGLEVKKTDAKGGVKTAKTDANGKFQFKYVPPGVYKFYSKDGLGEGEAMTTVEPVDPKDNKAVDPEEVTIKLRKNS